jgi:putative intracellular protease/amidase
MNSITTILLILGAIIIFLALILSRFLNLLGLHPKFDGNSFDLTGKKALIIATNHGVLSKPGETEGKPTGLFLSELSVPYYDFKKSGIKVEIASIKGGSIPLEPVPYFVETPSDKQFKKDKPAMNGLQNSISIKDIDFTNFDIIFLSGGWGAAYDLGFSDLLGEKISEAYNSSKAIFGGVCHGVLGFIKAKDKNGKLLISGRRMTGVTNKQLQELGINHTPQHPETELRKAGVIFESATAFKDTFANSTVVDEERRFVTGQNQNAGHETAFEIMKIVAQK